MSNTKTWGPEAFWGLDYDWDPQWVLTPGQRALQEKLIDLCRTTLRDNAVESDRNLVFPRENFEALASLGLLGLNVPREWGGLGEDHTCTAMVVETIARYGCASTAMCYTMHVGAVAAAMFRAHDNATLQGPHETPRQRRAGGHVILFGPGDGLSFLVPTPFLPGPSGWKAAGRCGRRRPGRRPRASPIGTSCRRRVRISRVTIRIFPAFSLWPTR